jgi:hypothetical protein
MINVYESGLEKRNEEEVGMKNNKVTGGKVRKGIGRWVERGERFRKRKKGCSGNREGLVSRSGNVQLNAA